MPGLRSTHCKGDGAQSFRVLLAMGCLKRSAQLLLQLLLLEGLRPAHGSTVLGTLDLQIDEEQPAGTIIGDISAGLPPSTTAYMYFISAQEGSGVTTDLEIDENTGIIKTARVLDRESRDHYSFIAVTPDGVTVEVTVQVNDINDHVPMFPKRHRTFQIPEHTPISSRFPLDPAFDADSGLLNTQGYMLKGENVGQAFRLETRRGPNGVLYLDLVVNNVLDRENCSSYSLLLEAYDGGSPPRSSQMTLDVAIQDINDNAPAFNQSRYHTLISENLKPGSSILQVFASDADEGDNGAVVYEINRRQSDPDQYFTIDARTGVIKLNKGLDYEMRRVHELVVQARDKAVHPEVTTAFVTIHVRDYNDNQPTMTIIFLSEDGSPQISEGAQPGQYVARISVSDPDYGEYSNVNVSLEGGDGKFALTTKDNIIYLICVDQLLDREERDSYNLRVTATDSGTPPLRAESAFVLQGRMVTARDKDQGPNGEVRYSILHSQNTHSNWFTIDPATGIITTAAPLDYEKDPEPQLTVLVMDRGIPVLSSTTVVYVALQDVNDNEPVFRSNFYNVSLKENTPTGTCFLQMSFTLIVESSIVPEEQSCQPLSSSQRSHGLLGMEYFEEKNQDLELDKRNQCEDTWVGDKTEEGCGVQKSLFGAKSSRGADKRLPHYKHHSIKFCKRHQSSSYPHGQQQDQRELFQHCQHSKLHCQCHVVLPHYKQPRHRQIQRFRNLLKHRH
nr:protocadherin-16 [Pelodiscus sinensis]|eukprot:XP_014431760.1 protocadherin-16 [Pelodiscus sinensis]